MKFESCLVNSTAISLLAYNEESSLMRVIFRHGNGYDYMLVERDIFESFVSAESVGQYFQKNIRGKYSCQKIDNGDAQDLLTLAISAASRLVVIA